MDKKLITIVVITGMTGVAKNNKGIDANDFISRFGIKGNVVFLPTATVIYPVRWDFNENVINNANSLKRIRLFI